MSDISVDTTSFDLDDYRKDQDLYNDSEWLGRQVTQEEGNSVNAFAEQYLAKQDKKWQGDIHAGLEATWGGKEKPSIYINGSVQLQNNNGNYINGKIQQSLSKEQSSVHVNAGKTLPSPKQNPP